MSKHGRVFDRRLPRVNPAKPPKDRHWPPDGVQDVGPRTHRERPPSFNRPRVRPKATIAIGCEDQYEVMP
jgi:hypothetical protein